MRKKKSLPKLKKELWKLFAAYIKKRDDYTCFTCGKKCEGKNAHAGHFIKASICGLNLYFHPDNVHCQDAYCNIWLDGNQYVYGVKLGIEKVTELLELKKIKPIWSRADYELMIAHYKNELTT